MARIGALHREPALEQGDIARFPSEHVGISRTTLGLTMLFQKAIAIPSGTGTFVINKSIVYRHAMVFLWPGCLSERI